MKSLFRYLNHNASKRIFGLDLLRFFAIFFVVYSHGNRLIRDYCEPGSLGILHFDGVSIFFVLSGFLIGRILIKTFVNEDAYNLKVIKNFWVRRWLRTIPVYFIVLIFLIFFDKYSVRNYNGYFFEYFTFTQNLFYNHPKFFPEAWSLSVEEWFYLTVPLFLLFVGRAFPKDKMKALLPLIIGFILVGIVYKLLRYNSLDPDIKKLYLVKLFGKQVLSRLPSIMYGVLGFNNPIGYFITHISIVSYSMYLINRFLRNTITDLNPIINSSDAFTNYWIYWISLIFFSSVLYYIVEKPIIVYRDKISKIIGI